MESNPVMELDACYFCTTPFQIIGAIQLVADRNEIADLYIIPQFENAHIYANRIEKLKIFFRVKVLNDKEIESEFFECKNPIRRKILMAKSYFRIDEKAKRILFSDTSYKTMYITNKTYCSRIVQLYFQKYCPEMNISYFDDGAASYCDQKWHIPKILDRMCRFLIFHVHEDKKTILSRNKYLFFPEMYKKINGTEENIFKIPLNCHSLETKEKFNYIFNWNENINSLQDVLILDTSRQDFSPEANQRIDSCYRMIFQIIGKDQVIIKPHPRNSAPAIQFGCNLFANASLPFELFIMNTDFNSKVLIALESTAVSMPKMLCNQEPVVILLYRAAQAGSSGQAENNKYFETLKTLYKDKAKVYIPSTMNELASVLHSVHDMIDK